LRPGLYCIVLSSRLSCLRVVCINMKTATAHATYLGVLAPSLHWTPRSQPLAPRQRGAHVYERIVLSRAHRPRHEEHSN
jgi:hypothetical protein